MNREIWVTARLSSLKDPKKSFEIKALVDNGSTDSAMPARLLAQMGVDVEGTETYEGWGGHRLRRRWGHARFLIQGRRGVGKVTFEPASEIPTIGATTLEDIGFDIDMGNGGLRPFHRRGPTVRRRPKHPLVR